MRARLEEAGVELGYAAIALAVDDPHTVSAALVEAAGEAGIFVAAVKAILDAVAALPLSYCLHTSSRVSSIIQMVIIHVDGFIKRTNLIQTTI